MTCFALSVPKQDLLNDAFCFLCKKQRLCRKMCFALSVQNKAFVGCCVLLVCAKQQDPVESYLPTLTFRSESHSL